MSRRPLEEALDRALVRARAGDARAAGAGALEALSLVHVLEAEGGLARLTPARRAALRALAPRILALPRGDEDHAIVLALARAALAALGGRRSSPPRSPLHVTDRALVAMRDGKPDPLAAGLAAAHVLGCASCRARLGVLRTVDVEPAPRSARPLLAAADSAPPMRRPASGRRLGAIAAHGVEAVLFEDGGARRVAVYASEPVAVRLVADGLTSEHASPGYWIGKLAARVRRIDAVLHVGRTRARWRLDLAPPSRSRPRPRTRAKRRKPL